MINIKLLIMNGLLFVLLVAELMISLNVFSKNNADFKIENIISNDTIHRLETNKDTIETEIIKIDSVNKTEEIYNFYVLEHKPEFPGGMDSLMKFIAKNIVYPQKAKEITVQGKVYVQFTINKKGKVEDVKVLRSVHPLLDEEAVRVVKMMPRWKPGKQRGKRVKVSYVLPIYFKAR